MVNYRTYDSKDILIHDFKSQACFSSLDDPQSAGIARIEYILYLNAMYSVKLSDEEINFYLNFLSVFLDNKIYTFVRNKNIITFNLNSTNLNRTKALVYLTAFRYLHEFKLLVSKFVTKAKEDNITEDEALFTLFCNIHWDMAKNSGYGYGGGHALYYPYFDKVKNVSTLSEFKAKLIDNFINTVHAHLTK